MALSNDCDPAGDIVLKLGSGDEATLIRVHSKVLSLASPVFAAMLSPRFAEGKALEDNKGMADSTTTIDLPDDDPEAMSLICRVLHFKDDAAQRTTYPSVLLMALAVLCDKYNMSRGLSSWSRICMEKFNREAKHDQFDIAWMSYGFEHHESFWKDTGNIIRHSSLAELDIEHDFLPDHVIGESPVAIINGRPILLIANFHIQVHSAFTAKNSSNEFNLMLKARQTHFFDVSALKITKSMSSAVDTSRCWDNT